MSNTTYATSPEAREAHEKMTKRISALIAKAESTTSPEEAAVFMAKAEELMLKHAIDRAKLEQLGKLAKEDIKAIAKAHADREAEEAKAKKKKAAKKPAGKEA